MLLCLVLFISLGLLAEGNVIRQSTCSDRNTFGFIVVGGGTAGLALATRLSQNFTNDCILVIEAGPDGRNESGIFIPGKKGSTFGTKYDWNLTTVPQVNAANRSISLVRGHVLGGSSAMNLMAWDRGAKADYDAWEELGNPGWNWDNMIRNMLKVENFTHSPFYGTKGVAEGGVIQTLINRLMPPSLPGFFPVMHKLGLKTNLNSLDGDPIGVMQQPTNLRLSDYSRSYSPRFLEVANDNLVLMLNTRVAKINFDGNLTATGITLTDGTIFGASKEVMLSSGTYLSPGLLEHSGIGDEAILTQAGVQTLYHLPGVGSNLQDHPRIQSAYIQRTDLPASFDRLKYNATYAAEQLALWFDNLTSQYDATGGGFGFLPWDTVSTNLSATLISLAQKSVNSSSPAPLQIQLQHLSNQSVAQLELIFSNGYNGVKGYPPCNSSLFGIETFTLIGGLMHPFSRGSIHINSPNISDKPTLNPQYLSSPVDITALTAVAKYLRQIATTAPLSGFWTAEYEPGPAVQTDEDWENYARSAILSIDHPVGTCVMLPESEDGVVDSRLRVYGVKGVRVVDASIAPLLVSGHIQTMVYGIAEMAAELIVEDWQ